MKYLLLLACVITMTGCAAELVSVNDKLIVVKARPSRLGEAQDIAETECLKRGLHARLTTRPAEGQYGFDCVR